MMDPNMDSKRRQRDIGTMDSPKSIETNNHRNLTIEQEIHCLKR